jgi:hypothetical protein
MLFRQKLQTGLIETMGVSECQEKKPAFWILLHTHGSECTHTEGDFSSCGPTVVSLMVFCCCTVKVSILVFVFNCVAVPFQGLLHFASLLLPCGDVLPRGMHEWLFFPVHSSECTHTHWQGDSSSVFLLLLPLWFLCCCGAKVAIPVFFYCVAVPFKAYCTMQVGCYPLVRFFPECISPQDLHDNRLVCLAFSSTFPSLLPVTAIPFVLVPPCLSSYVRRAFGESLMFSFGSLCSVLLHAACSCFCLWRPDEWIILYTTQLQSVRSWNKKQATSSSSTDNPCSVGSCVCCCLSDDWVLLFQPTPPQPLHFYHYIFGDCCFTTAQPNPLALIEWMNTTSVSFPRLLRLSVPF